MEKFTLLVATDFSENSMDLLQKAIDFTASRQGNIHVVHVVESSFFQESKRIDLIKEHCWEKLSSSYPFLKKEQFHCFKGNLEKTISIVAQTIGADMVMIGDNRTKHPIEEIFMSSDTKAIIRESHIPIVVSKNKAYREYKTILIPTDLSQASSRVIQEIAHLFPDALLILLHLYSIPFEFRLGVYGFNENEIAQFKDESRRNAETQLKEFIHTLNLPAKQTLPIVRKDLLSSERFEENHKDLQADMVAIHTTGSISFFAFDLLEKSSTDVFIYKVQ